MNFPEELFTCKPSTVWEHSGILCGTVPNPFGSMNGYCVLPADHPLGSLDLQFKDCEKLDVHGGITFGPKSSDDGRLVIGWDTAHWGDYAPHAPFGRRWTEQEVIEETNRLAIQVAHYAKEGAA